MKNEFDKKQDLSQPPVRLQNRSLELSARQDEIHRNLQAIGPEIAAFYLSGVKVLQDDDLETSSYLLAHIAREIEGGLRDVLSEKREEHLEFIVHMPNGEKLTHEKRVKDTLEFVIDTPGSVKLTYKKVQGNHKASILQSLGVDENSPIAEKWISVAKRFAAFAHRHGAWKPPRRREVFVPLWHKFEDVLEDLVGNHFNLLNRIDHILKREQPTKEIIQTLPNLLKSEVRYAYFFQKLESPAWLERLKDAGWFDPRNQSIRQDGPDQSEYYRSSVWHALKYVEKVANHTQESPCEKTFNILADIVNAIVDYTNDIGESIASDHTDWRVITIICTLPIEKIEIQHITFIGVSVRSRERDTLVDSAISEVLLPKLLDADAKELTLALLKVMLEVKVVNDRIIPVMEKYWLTDALKTHGETIARLCSVEATQVTLTQIQNLIDQGAYSFDLIQQVEGDASEESHKDYAELLVSFTSTLFRYAELDSIVEKVKTLLQESLTIFRRIAITAIAHHYENLKQLFWDWQGNPLNETSLKPEIYQLLRANCLAFDEGEIDQVLHWIESQQNLEGSEDDDIRAKQVAYRKREWLSALLETGNQKVISASQKYKQINPAEIDHPGLLWWTEVRWGEISPVTVESFSDMSNVQIAEYLVEFEEDNTNLSAPTERGLAQTLEECVGTNPQRFTSQLQSFQRVGTLYQCSILSGLLTAWRDKKEFNWAALLKFIHQILSSERFWEEQHETGLNYRDWVLSVVADLVTAGTKNNEYAFDVQLLPLAEEILLILVGGKVESEGIVTAGRTVDLPLTFLNSVKGKTFTAMMDYALQFARTNNIEQGIRWPPAIKRDFTKRLDRNIENSIGFSFALGAYLPNLLYLDKEWVISHIDNIFPQQDENYWRVAFSGYLYYADIREDIYYLLKAHGHYQKGLNTDFTNTEVQERLVTHVCTGWIEGSETLNDETSLIYQLINSDNPNLLSTLIHFFWRQRDNLPLKMQEKVMPTWHALFEALSQKDDIGKYEEVLSKLSGWVALVDTIDAEVLKWLKMSTQYIRGLTDSAFFVEELLPHATKTPAEVGDIYLGMLTHNVYPYHDQEHIQGIVRVLYSTGHTEVANRICNLYGAAGFDFLRSLYDENQN